MIPAMAEVCGIRAGVSRAHALARVPGVARPGWRARAGDDAVECREWRVQASPRRRAWPAWRWPRAAWRRASRWPRPGPGITGLGPVRRALFPRLAGQGDPGHVALTFDDGPDPAATPKFLELLADREVSATFFLLGQMVARAPGLAAELTAAGHEVGVHGWEHRYLPLRGPRATFEDIRRATETIARAAGHPAAAVPAAVRGAERVRPGSPPGGWGWPRCCGAAWGREWTPGATPDSVYASLSGRLRGGVTVLLHDSDCTSPPGSWRAALGALPRLLDECARRGLAVGPLGQHGWLVAPTAPTASPPAAHGRPARASRTGADGARTSRWLPQPRARRGRPTDPTRPVTP